MQADGKSDDRRISQNLVAYDQSETFTKISNYFESACRAMRNEREAKKSLLDNPADIGQTVETIYLDFLKQHIPAVCDVLQGGYVFDVEGCRSHQMDIIVHSGNAYRFRDSSGLACATLEGTVANIEVTSYLDRRKIDGDLKKFAFIPPTRQFRGLGNREAFKSIEGVQEWWSDTPYKAVVAFDGVDAKTALEQINSFYSINHHVPVARRINILHMLDQYCIIKSDFDVHPDIDPSQRGEYTAVGSGRVDTLATSLILTRISQLLHLVTRNAYTSNDLRRNIMKSLPRLWCGNSIPVERSG